MKLRWRLKHPEIEFGKREQCYGLYCMDNTCAMIHFSSPGLVATATGTISHSITITEGHIIYAFNPATNNNDLVQSGKLRHRSSQNYGCKII